MSSSDPPTQQDQALVSVRPRLRGGGRGGSNVGGGVAGSGHEDTILAQLSAAKPLPLRPPLATGLPSSPLPPYLGSQPTNPGSCPGPVQQLLHQQLAQKEQLPLAERDRQIAMVEEELKLSRKMLELERQEKETQRAAIQLEEARKEVIALNGFGRIEDTVGESEASEDMLKQMEIVRQEELNRMAKEKLENEASSKITHLSSNEVTKQKVREMLERKKRELNLRNSTNSSAGSSLKDLLLKKTELQNGGNELFTSDEENEQMEFGSKAVFYDDPTRVEKADLTSVLGEVIPDQKMIWERIQRERREEEERISGMKHNEVVQEQQEILRKIQEQNLARKKEEELTLKLIAELSLSDHRQQQQQQLRRNEAATATARQSAPMPNQGTTPYQAHQAAGTAHQGVAAALPAAARRRDVGHVEEDWRVVGARVKEKVASLKIAAELDEKRRETAVMEEWRREMLEREEEERRRQFSKWEVNQKVRVVKSVDRVQDVEDGRNGTTFRDILNKNSSGINQNSKLSKDEGRRELGARRKSEGAADVGGEKKKAAEDLKTRMVEQEKELRARVEKEAIEREWELATRRRESRGGLVPTEERTGQISRHARLEQNMNQKMRKQK